MEDCYRDGQCVGGDLKIGDCSEDTREEEKMSVDPLLDQSIEITQAMEDAYQEVMSIPDLDLDMANIEVDAESESWPVPEQVKPRVAFRDLLEQFKQLDCNVKDLQEVLSLLNTNGKGINFATKLLKNALEAENDSREMLLDSVITME